jgi:ACS family hexuronate transporter-like MFS transporter
MENQAAQTKELQKASNYRWAICFLLLAAMAINYIHRQTLGLLKNDLQGVFHWDENGYANVVFWFQAAYAVGYVSFGRIIDKIGAKAGYTIAFTLWVVAHTFTGFATNILQFTLARVALGLGESGSFPASLKAIAEWFPQKERAAAAGVFNAGSNIGAIIAPLVVPLLTLSFGWQSAFYVTGAASFIWLIVWQLVYRHPTEHPKVNEAELAIIQSDPPDTSKPIPWAKLLGYKETWAYAISKFLIDPIWWFYLFWLPDFLSKTYQMDLKSSSVAWFAIGLPLVVIYLISDVGSVVGGFVSSNLIKRGVSVNWARKITLLIFALCVLPIFFVTQVGNMWAAVLIIGIATAAHQAFSANIYTLPSDTFPKAAVASVIGIGGTVGAIGGMIFSKTVGAILQATGSYHILFIIAGSVYLLAVVFVHILSPRLAKVEI